MDLKKQKMLRFIPIVQLLVVFYWFKANRPSVKFSRILKIVLVIALGVYLLSYLFFLLTDWLSLGSTLSMILKYVELYVEFVLIASVLIRDHEKHNN